MNNTSTKVEFLQFHQPSLKDGDYTIQVQQLIEEKENRIPKIHLNLDPAEPGVFANLEKKFHVQGERFHLKPQDIRAVFPPVHNLGEHSNVLPHIVLNRSTLPWERVSNHKDVNDPKGDLEEDKDTPWMALLVFYEDEMAPLPTSPEEDVDQLEKDKLKVTTSVVPLSTLMPPATTTSPYFPGLHLEKGQKATDQAKVIDVPKGLLTQLLPTAEELQMLAHVRQPTDDNDVPTDRELAVIIANRLPEPGKTSTVHLVSLESRLENGSFNFKKNPHDDSDTTIIPDLDNDGKPNKIRLVSLKSWDFTCLEHYAVNTNLLHHFKADSLAGIDPNIPTIENLNPSDYFSKKDFLTALKDSNKGKLTPDDLNRTDGRGVSNQTKILKAFGYGHFAAILKHLDRATLALPTVPTEDIQGRPMAGAQTANDFLKMSFTPVKHHFRKGDTTVSWFHGPLVAHQDTHDKVALQLPVLAADPLIQYYPMVKMLDVSYAAAWEMGRLLTLQDKTFSTGLYRWKRNHVHELRKRAQREAHQAHHLPGADDIDLNAHRLPEELRAWFYDLHLLKGLPFNYLVPEEAMLPTGSIRFFTVDKLWLASLLDGAFSMGRVISHDHQKDENLIHAVIKQAFDAENSRDLDQETGRSLMDVLGSVPQISGFLLRSEVVSGWPDLVVEGYNQRVAPDQEPDESTAVKLVRMQRLSASVLLCLFSGTVEDPMKKMGVIQTVDIHVRPEAMHFGFSVKGDTRENATYEKKLRKSTGEEHETDPDKYTVSVPFRQPLAGKPEVKNVLNVKGLEEEITKKYNAHPNEIGWRKDNPTSEVFALQMIEGVEKVRFIVGT